MLQIHQNSTLALLPKLRDEMFRDRKEQFIDRLGWDIDSDEFDREVDCYDSEDATYLIYTNSRADHLGSLRLTDCSRSSMMKDHFAKDFPNVRNFSSEELEVTRFCISPTAKGADARYISKRLIGGAFFYALEEKKVEKIVGVCYRPMLRIYRQANASPTSIEFGRNDSKLVLTKWKVTVKNFTRVISDKTNKENLNTDYRRNDKTVEVQNPVEHV